MNSFTDFLVAKNDFVSGMSRAVDLGSTRNKRIYNSSKQANEADEKAIYSDWSMTGKDIWEAYGKFKQKV